MLAPRPRDANTDRTAARQLLEHTVLLLALGAAAPFSAIAAGPELTRPLHEQAVARASTAGAGLTKDPMHAALLNCQVQQLRHAEASHAFSWMLANGRGAPRSDSLAVDLVRYSSAQGHQPMARMLALRQKPDAPTPECMRAALSHSTRGQDATFAAKGGAEPNRSNPSAGLTADKQKLADLVRELAPQYGVDPRLALALVRVESNFDPHALSPMNAQGLMQLIPDTAKRFNVRNAFDPADNVRGGLTYLRWLLAYYQGRVVLAAAAYNAGEGAVDRHGGVPPYRETQEYVGKITRFFGAEQHLYDGRLVDPSPAFPRRGGRVL